MLSYKGYVGRVTFDEDARVFHGQVLDTLDVITYQGTTVDEIESAFRDSIDDYLEFCAERGESPDKPFSGKITVRLPKDLHRELHIGAKLRGVSLNQFIADTLKEAAN